MAKLIPYGRQSIDDTDIESVVEILKSDYLTQGPTVERFEKALADYTGAQHCVAVSSGTAALHLAAAALIDDNEGFGITSPNTFVASSNCMVYRGLSPRFADIDPKTYNVTTESIKSISDKNTCLIIPVHFAGQPCEMAEISECAKYHNWKIIEDASHAIGSNYTDGSKVGNCRYSDATVFSFHPVKTITCGEGGAITTNTYSVYQDLKDLRTHGITKDAERMHQIQGPWYYEMQSLGYNYRISDIHCALGISQLQKLERFKKRRREIVDFYNREFEETEWLITPFEGKNVDSCFHLYVVQIDFDLIGLNRIEVMRILKERGVGTQVHYIPVYDQPFYQEHYPGAGSHCVNNREYYSRTLSLPLYPAMNDGDVELVVESVKKLGNE